MVKKTENTLIVQKVLPKNPLFNGVVRPHMSDLEKISHKVTRWVGTPQSIIVHSFLFVGIFIFTLFGVGIDKIMLVLTTVVSLEAIYLSLFIQMTVNRNTESLEDVEEDIEDIREDVEELSEDIDDIQEDDKQERKTTATLKSIEDDLDKLLSDIQTLKKEININNTTKKYLNG